MTIIRKAGVPMLGHAAGHKAQDGVDSGLEKFEEVDDSFSDKARENIENLPLAASLAIKKASEELLIKIDLALDKMTGLGEKGIERTKELSIEGVKFLSD